jgi:hypothetical protein
MKMMTSTEMALASHSAGGRPCSEVRIGCYDFVRGRLAARRSAIRCSALTLLLGIQM